MSQYKVIIEHEYYKLDPSKPTIGLLMMLKNEKKRLHVTLNSVIGNVDALIIFDTGSTDETLDIIQNFSKKYKINLYLIQGEFVNFSISRNVSLEYADKIGVNYLLLLDCNDELKSGKNLRNIAKEYLDKENNAFLVCQEWFTGVLDKYYNIRFVKNRCGWRYMGSVHEWLKDTSVEGKQSRYQIIKIPDNLNIVLYQDRTQDDDKTGKRFHRDRELLLNDYKKDPTDSRTLFYLAQTCECLGKTDEALYFSKLRLEHEGFTEELFHSYMRCGNSCMILDHNWEDCLGWYMKAYEYMTRAEPLVKIADYYRLKANCFDKEDIYKKVEHDKKEEEKFVELKGNYQRVPYNRKPNNFWRISYMFLREACDLEYPYQCILFVDKGTYDYYRWHLMGIVAFYVKKYDEGKEAALKAIATGINKTENEKILQFYLDRVANKQTAIDTRTEFINKTIEELKIKMPDVEISQLTKRAVAMWKKKQKS